MSDSGLARMCLHSTQEFQSWLANDLEVRDELSKLIGHELGTDEESLDELESFLLRRYRKIDDSLALNERGVLDAAARHIGLVFLLNVDGTSWAIDLENEDDVFYRLPIIRLSDGAAACPLTMATASLDRRTGTYLRGIVESYEEDYNE